MKNGSVDPLFDFIEFVLANGITVLIESHNTELVEKYLLWWVPQSGGSSALTKEVIEHKMPLAILLSTHSLI